MKSFLDLTEAQRNQLRGIVARRDPELIRLLDPSTPISGAEVEQLMLLVSRELTYAGFDEAWEPTPLGIELEALLDSVNHCGFT